MNGMGYSASSSSHKLIGFGPTSNNQETMGTLVIGGVRDIFSKVSTLNSKYEKSSQLIHPIITINQNLKQNTNPNSTHLPGVAGGGWCDEDEVLYSKNIENMNLNDFNESFNGKMVDKEKIHINNEYLLLDIYLEASTPFSHLELDSLLKNFQCKDVCLYLNEKLIKCRGNNLMVSVILRILFVIEVIIYNQDDLEDIKGVFCDALTECSLQNEISNVQFKSKKILMILTNS